MTKDAGSNIQKATVSGVGLVANQGTPTVILHLMDSNDVVFDVNLQVIGRLRQVLTEAEQVLRQQPGRD